MPSALTKSVARRVKGFLLAAVAGALGACMPGVTHPVGPAREAHSPGGHLRIACDLEERADVLEAEFDAHARRRMGPVFRTNHASGMKNASAGREPRLYNPTLSYLDMARSLRREAARHRAAAFGPVAAAPRGCDDDAVRYTTYGGNWFLW